jgi:beta-carotene hydroxylase
MWLRYRADYRTLLWALFMPVASLAQYARPDLVAYLFPLSCYLALLLPGVVGGRDCPQS